MVDTLCDYRKLIKHTCVSARNVPDINGIPILAVGNCQDQFPS